MNRRKYRSIVAWLASVGLLFVSSFVLAQPRPGRGRMAMAPRYDTAAEITTTGTVSAVEEISAERCPSCMGGVHVVVEADGESYEVHVGPAAFLKEKDWTFEVGDRIEVVGSKVEMNGEATLIAREIRRGEETLVLRDEKGLPLWRGARRPS